MTYVRTNWVNDQTPLNADNMNNIESGIEQALAQGGAVVITSGGSVTEKTFTIPTLTNKQVVDAHNALASGKPCIVDSQDGNEHYIVDNANGSAIAINIVYSNRLIVTYTENSEAEDANATISSVELGGDGSKLYEHNITWYLNNKDYITFKIINKNNTSLSSIDLIKTELINKELNNANKCCLASGCYDTGTVVIQVRGIFSYSGTGIVVDGYKLNYTINGSSVNVVSEHTNYAITHVPVITDTVVEL